MSAQFQTAIKRPGEIPSKEIVGSLTWFQIITEEWAIVTARRGKRTSAQAKLKNKCGDHPLANVDKYILREILD